MEDNKELETIVEEIETGKPLPDFVPEGMPEEDYKGIVHLCRVAMYEKPWINDDKLKDFVYRRIESGRYPLVKGSYTRDEIKGIVDNEFETWKYY